MSGGGASSAARALEGALVVLPAGTPVAALAERIALRSSADGLERFGLLAHSQALQAGLDLALARADALEALVLVACAPPTDPGLAQRLAGLKVPTLALFGTRDPQAPPKTGRAWRALLPSCHVVFVYDAGHDLAADQPLAFADIVSDFVRDPAAFLINRRDGSVPYA